MGIKKQMGKNESITPILKWVGGKRQSIPAILKLLPSTINSAIYIEPFIGAGALFFYLQPKNAIINDFNPELINVYRVIKENPDELIEDLRKHKNERDYFYNIRKLDRTKNFGSLTPVQKASRLIYLNKTCFNGLYRVNRSGEFNVPYGRYRKPNIVNESALRAVSQYLNGNRIQLKNTDFEEVLKRADKHCFFYLDPPYYPVSESSNFTGYIKGGWDREDQYRLKTACDDLNRRGIKFLLSNSATDFILGLYKDYKINTIKSIRAINSIGDKRGKIDEVLIRNYE
jgi:DNA adenine methylase